MSPRPSSVPANTPNKLLQVQTIAGGTPPPPPPPPPGNLAPVAAFTTTCSRTPSPARCVLDAGPSTDDGGKANLTFAWTNTAGRPAKTGTTATYFIAVSGYPNTFNVTLTVTDSQGLTNAITQQVVIP